MKLDKKQQQFFAPVHQPLQLENDQNTNSNINTSNPAEQHSMKSGNSDSQSQSQNNDSQFAQSENNQTLIPHSVAPPRSASTFAIPIVQTPLPVFRETSIVEAQKHDQYINLNGLMVVKNLVLTPHFHLLEDSHCFDSTLNPKNHKNRLFVNRNIE
ncbi:MAG: hypothetical protein EZS28_000435 [Streblomastix strix]|uniref:Uncharacterized protein n=1 Tax=Streblomastix strix TaxID=222440 RepID=A0A5J4XBW8_9EUKA|nr:MAG: hypothetical protein EZS28_000435 [Streblomastix strix]